MSSRMLNLTRDQQGLGGNCNQTLPLLDSRSNNNTNNVSTAGSNAIIEHPFLPEGTGAALSIQLGSVPSSVPSESHGYSEIPSPTFDRLHPRNVHATEVKQRYDNDSTTLTSPPKKIRPVPRPPPRSVSESEVSNHRPPPRTYLNNRVQSPSSANRNPIVTDCTNEINENIQTTNGTAKPGRLKLCFLMAFVAIFLALAMAATAAAFAIHTYLITRNSKQVQETKQQNMFGLSQNQSTASAHVGLMVDGSIKQEISDRSNYTLHLTDDKSKLHYQNVNIWKWGLTITTKGLYFVYSNIGFNINENRFNCDEEDIKTWVHQVYLGRGTEKTSLLRSEHTCCTGCPEDHSTGFVGGVFELLPDDNIFVQVSAPVFVFDDKESSFLGLFLIK